MTADMNPDMESHQGISRDSVVANLTFEIIPLTSAESAIAALPPHSTVSVTCSPVKGLAATQELTDRVRSDGHLAIPHLAARMVESRGHLDIVAGWLEAEGIDTVFVVGGDAEEPIDAALERLLSEKITRKVDKWLTLNVYMPDGKNWKRVRFWGYPTRAGYRYGKEPHVAMGVVTYTKAEGGDDSPTACLKAFAEKARETADEFDVDVADLHRETRTHKKWVEGVDWEQAAADWELEKKRRLEARKKRRETARQKKIERIKKMRARSKKKRAARRKAAAARKAAALKKSAGADGKQTSPAGEEAAPAVTN